jgi:two-component system sensor histidine kinase ChvG
MQTVREDILKVFLVALAVTVLLSLYLAGTITRPIRRLARAAEAVRTRHGRQKALPDFSRRRDEIGDLSEALREMTAALWARMDAIERFAADVSHEIKNPLTSLRSAVETVARVNDPEQQRRLMSILLEDVQRLDRLITDISDASRLDAELSRAQSDTVDIRRMLEMLAELYRSTGGEDGPRIDLDIRTPEALTVQGLESRIVQVFRNLITNAVSFSPKGGRITLAAGRIEGWVEVTVEDEGPGIPPGKLDAIFDRFYSERPAGEKFGTHSGLGLSISKQIIDAHHGVIFARNREGRSGARFTVRLPALK